ncbi:MAG: lipopolysaccharide biosynthesis protein [Thermodesulfobacteriota bacterium]|nr:lipopolysaccharide biosynthesis protein [Thermodesulfobacteriota bacterium]
MSKIDKKEDLSSRTKSGLKWNTAMKIVSQVVRFVVGIILARILDPLDFGIMAIGHMIIHYTNSISDFGFINALVQKKDLQQVHIDSVFTLNLIVSVILCILVAASSTAIGNFFNSPESGKVLFFMSFLFIIRTFRDIYMALLRRRVLFKAVATTIFIEHSCMSIIALLLALSGMRYWSLVWATIIATGLAGVLFFIQTKERPRFQYHHKAMKSIYSFGLWNFLRAQLFFINQFITQLIVGKLFGPVALGYFEKSHQLASMPRESIAAQINAVMFSSFSRLQTDTEKLKEWFLKITIMETILVVPILAGLIAVADHFIIVVLGEKWAPSIISLQILSLGVIFQVLNGLIASLNVGTGRFKRQALLELPGTILFILLCYPLSKWGINGIAACYTISMLFVSIVTFHLVRESLNLSLIQFVKPILPYLVVNVLMVVFVQWLARVFFHHYSITNLLVLVSAGGSFYLCATMIVNLSTRRNFLFPLKT